MVEVVKEVRGVFTAPVLVGKVFPIGLGAVASDRFGDRIADVLPAGVKAILGRSLDATGEALAGVGIVGLAGIMPPGSLKSGVRLAGIAGIGLGVFHLIGQIIGSSPGSSSPPRVVKRVESTPVRKTSFSRY